jgi:hypothetical protein
MLHTAYRKTYKVLVKIFTKGLNRHGIVGEARNVLMLITILRRSHIYICEHCLPNVKNTFTVKNNLCFWLFSSATKFDSVNGREGPLGDTVNSIDNVNTFMFV